MPWQPRGGAQLGQWQAAGPSRWEGGREGTEAHRLGDYGGQGRPGLGGYGPRQLLALSQALALLQFYWEALLTRLRRRPYLSREHQLGHLPPGGAACGGTKGTVWLRTQRWHAPASGDDSCPERPHQSGTVAPLPPQQPRVSSGPLPPTPLPRLPSSGSPPLSRVLLLPPTLPSEGFLGQLR